MDSIVIENIATKKKSLRLAIVTETYPPEVNGVALSLSRFVEGLSQLNHEIQLVRPRQQDDGRKPLIGEIEEVLTTGLPIPKYPNLKMGLPAKKRLVGQWTMRRPDLVHIVTEGPLGWSALEAARKLKIPVSSDFRTNFHSYSQHYGIGWLKRPIVGYLRKFHNKAALTTVPTEHMRRELSGIGFKNVRVLSRGVNAALYSPERRSPELRAQWGVTDDYFTVVHVGRLAAEKNLKLLFKAYVALRQKDSRVRLVMVGDGPAITALQQRHPEVIFSGVRHGEDLATHYASADLFVFPSLTETFGNVTLEAMASGLPVVAFDYAAAAQYLTAESGCLAPVDD
ncbi:MAG: glycosyltransferase family 1 protein, partial [Rhodocyclaceae bacterium]|nr:glycosyltransferase family 1 protein [Rhodocyclaceae bacterium]